MQTLGSAAEMDAFHRSLRGSARVGAQVSILTIDGEQLVTTLGTDAFDGTIDIDADAEVATRSCQLSFRDPTGAVTFATDSPDERAIGFKHMVQVRQWRYVAELDKRIWGTTFTGPVTQIDRTGRIVEVQAQGKEALAGRGVRAMTASKGQNAVGAIQQILSRRCGETRFSLPSMRDRLPADVTVGRAEEVRPWVVCQQIARSLDLHLFYDGPGVCRARDVPGDATYDFDADVAGANILTDPAWSASADTVTRVEVVGSRPQFSYAATVGVDHLLYVERDGSPLFVSEEITDDKIGSAARARRVAERRLAEGLLGLTDVTFTARQAWHLDPLDVCRVSARSGSGLTRFRRASWSIRGGPMTVGARKLRA